MADATTPLTCAELEEILAKLRHQLDAASRDQATADRAAGQHFADIAAGRPQNKEALAEQDRAAARIRTLVVAIEEAEQALTTTREQERVTAALAQREQLRGALQQAFSVGGELEDALQLVAVKAEQLLDRLAGVAHHAPKRRVPGLEGAHIDNEWRYALTPMHLQHMMMLGLYRRLGRWFAYDRVPGVGGIPGVDNDLHQTAAQALATFDQYNRLESLGLPSMPTHADVTSAASDDAENEALIAALPTPGLG